jgi:site-specific recombinase XerD
MKLLQAVNEYVHYKQAIGMRFGNDASGLTTFCRALGPNVSLNRITAAQVQAFLHSSGEPTRTWARKYWGLVGFNRYIVGHGYTDGLPLPIEQPCISRTFVPYILNRDELRRLLGAVRHCCKRRSLQPRTARAILLLLYGAGLRVGEAAGLTLNDVDLTAALLTVRRTKFYKTRLVPLGSQLREIMGRYLEWRNHQGHSRSATAPFFVLRSGAPVRPRLVWYAFAHPREHAKVFHADGQRPRVHDIRHSFAVHRLLAWYRRGADVQTLLPALSVYMGHKMLASTQVYLTTIPELLREANRRFENYVGMEVTHA